MKSLLIKLFLKKALCNPCAERVPRSGKKGEAVNCFFAKLKLGNDSELLIQKTGDNHFEGLWYDGEGFNQEACVSYNSIKLSQIIIVHYYGLYEITYYGLVDYFINGTTGYERLKAKLHLNKEKLAQYIFNKKSLATIQRIELLRTLINHHIERNGAKISSLQTMSNLYTDRWYLHPQKDHQKNQVELFLNSFAESGEIEKVENIYFIVKGKAITTLSKYEENERRHKENKAMQRIIVVVVNKFRTQK